MDKPNELYNNFDHTFEPGAIEWLKDNPGKSLAHHAWNFVSHVKYVDGKFIAEVWRYRAWIDTIEKVDCEELISVVNDIYGHE